MRSQVGARGDTYISSRPILELGRLFHALFYAYPSWWQRLFERLHQDSMRANPIWSTFAPLSTQSGNCSGKNPLKPDDVGTKDRIVMHSTICLNTICPSIANLIDTSSDQAIWVAQNFISLKER